MFFKKKESRENVAPTLKRQKKIGLRRGQPKKGGVFHKHHRENGFCIDGGERKKSRDYSPLSQLEEGREDRRIKKKGVESSSIAIKGRFVGPWGMSFPHGKEGGVHKPDVEGGAVNV